MAKKSDKLSVTGRGSASPTRTDFLHRSWMKNQGLPDHVLRRTAGDRHLQYVVRADAVQRPFSAASPTTSSAASTRPAAFPGRVSPWMVAGRDPAAADRDAVPQPRQPWTSRNRSAAIRIDGRGAADRLRQDHARPADGCGLLRPCRPSCLSGGPMLNGKFHGHDIGSRHQTPGASPRIWRAGKMSLASFMEAEGCMSAVGRAIA